MKRLLAVLLCCALVLPAFVYARALETSAASAAVLDAATGALMYAKNENMRRSMASTTKIMTALVVLENGDLDAVYRVKKEDASIEGSSLGLCEADRISVRALLYGLMLVSGNDAAHALAVAVCGSEKSFVDLMNQKAAGLGLNDTHFMNPAGLTHKEHYSTAKDMAYLTAYALSNKTFRKICALSDAQITFVQPKKTVYLHNHNKLLGTYKGCIGVKTGYTLDAGRCLVSAAERHGQTIIAVTLDDGDDWSDHEAMLDDAFRASKRYSFDLRNIRIPVVGSEVQNIKLSTSEISFYLPRALCNKVEVSIYAPHFLYAPVKEKQPVAKLVFRIGDKVIKTYPLYSALDAARQQTVQTESIWYKLFHYG
ncbi:MAG: D-alanyl-D-alanine carboxypeptidase [Clostridia bacterium]|nr:D-alanyl-D-alanine carboxypeptidase [Clostridia bacterium]